MPLQVETSERKRSDRERAAFERERSDASAACIRPITLLTQPHTATGEICTADEIKTAFEGFPPSRFCKGARGP